MTQLQGAAIPASVLESDVLPSRVDGYSSADLDALLASGAIVWAGAGGLGAADGRVRLYFRDQAPLLFDDPSDLPEGPVHDAIRAHLGTQGASFWPELFSVSQLADQNVVLAALWDLVWCGEVTNDTLAPVRGLLAGGKSPRSKGAARRGRPRPGQLSRLGPPSAAGRWSLTASLNKADVNQTERAHFRALQLIERHGVLTREGALADGVPGGFAGVYPVLRALEERGQVRRGYFVAGLGGAQFASPGAVDRLRRHREADDEPTVVVLAATDPAQPYGGSLQWPTSNGRPSRSAGAYVVLVDGEPAVFVERGGRSLATFDSTLARPTAWLPVMMSLVTSGRVRQFEIAKIDGEIAMGTKLGTVLVDNGFAPGYKGPTFRG